MGGDLKILTDKDKSWDLDVPGIIPVAFAFSPRLNEVRIFSVNASKYFDPPPATWRSNEQELAEAYAAWQIARALPVQTDPRTTSGTIGEAFEAFTLAIVVCLIYWMVLRDRTEAFVFSLLGVPQKHPIRAWDEEYALLNQEQRQMATAQLQHTISQWW